MLVVHRNLCTGAHTSELCVSHPRPRVAGGPPGPTLPFVASVHAAVTSLRNRRCAGHPRRTWERNQAKRKAPRARPSRMRPGTDLSRPWPSSGATPCGTAASPATLGAPWWCVVRWCTSVPLVPLLSKIRTQNLPFQLRNERETIRPEPREKGSIHSRRCARAWRRLSRRSRGGGGASRRAKRTMRGTESVWTKRETLPRR